MFSLIVTVISIALVAALALATIYYGSSAHAEASSRAQVARLISESAQIHGAAQAYRANENQTFSSLGQLVAADYLKSVPVGEWQVVDGAVVRTDLTEDQCLAANRQLGIDEVPQCSDPAISGMEVCCNDA